MMLSAFGQPDYLQADYQFGKIPSTSHSRQITRERQEGSTKLFSVNSRSSDVPKTTELGSRYRNGHSDCVKSTGQQIDLEYRASIGISEDSSRHAVPTTCFTMAEPVILSQSSPSTVNSPVASFKAAFTSPPPPVVVAGTTPLATSPSCTSTASSSGSFHSYKSSNSAKYHHTTCKPSLSSLSTSAKCTPTHSSIRPSDSTTHQRSQSPLHCSTTGLNGSISATKHASPSPSTSPRLARSPDRSSSPNIISNKSGSLRQKADTSKRTANASDFGSMTDNEQSNHSPLASGRHVSPRVTKQCLTNLTNDTGNESHEFDAEDQERPHSTISRISASDSNGSLINGHREDDDLDDDEMMNNFDPTEVLKRMKVELKEEFDETDRNGATSVDLVDSDCDNISNARHKDLHKSPFGSFLGNFENEYFRKLMQMDEASEMGEACHPSLATLTAAAAAVGAAPSPETLLDENKKRLLQTLLLKQFNSDSNGLDSSLLPEMQPSTSNAVNGCTTSSAAQAAAAAVNFFQSLMPKLAGKTFDEPKQRYCSSCNIQFMSSKTYKVHKELYCSSRHQNSSSSSPSTTSSTAPASSTNFTISMTGSSLCNDSSKSSPLINSQTSSGLGSSPPLSSFSSVASPNSSPNLTSTRKRTCVPGADMSSLPTAPRTHPTRQDMILSEESVVVANAHPSPSFADLASMFPHLMQSSLNNLVNAGGSSGALNAPLPPPTEPIYIVISTNPLVLLPFACNPVTNGLEPLTNHLSGAFGQASVIDSLGKSLAPQLTSPIVFPTGLPHSRQPSNDLSPASTSANSQFASQTPFITTFADLRDHLNLSTSVSELQHSCSSPTKSISDKPVSSIGKKRSLSESSPGGSSEQPLDLSSSSPKRCKESDDLSHRSLSPTNIKKEQKEESTTSKDLSFQEHMANFIQKIAMMNPMPSSQPSTSTTPAPETTSNLLFHGATQSAPVTDQLGIAASLARDNPAFAQYIAMAVAALTGSGLSGSNNAASNLSGSQPHIDVVVKQGNSRCSECNIVFYKYENYLVHKKLYCASRRTLDSSQSQPSSSPTHVPSINRPPSASPSCPSPVGSQASFSQQAAKFAATLAATNSDLVRAALKSEETPLRLSTSPALSREAASVSPVASIMSPGKQSAVFQYYCVACGIKFTSYDNLHAHQTYYCLKRGPSAGSSSSTAAAPVSPARISPLPTSPVPSGATPQSLLLATAAAAAGLGAQTTPETLLADLASQNALTQQWAQMVAAAAAVAKSNGAIPPGTSFGDFNCQKCKASYVSQETLAAHVCSADLRLPEKPEKPANVTPSTASLQTYKCTICGYKGHTMRGMRTHVRVHSDELANSGAYEEEFIVQNTDLPEPSSGRRGSHGNSLTNPSRQRRRSSGVDASFLAAPGVDAMDIRSAVNSYLESAARRNKEALEERKNSISNDLPQNHNCQFCPYTSNYKGNVIRHIKLVHKDVAMQHVQTGKDFEGSVTVGGAVAPSDLDERCSQKSEDGASTGKSPSRHLNGNLETSSNASTTSPEAANGTGGDAESDSNYCSSCNISFTYRNSYVAHKKYYCSSHNNET